MPDDKNVDVINNRTVPLELTCEQELRSALARVNAPDGFTDRLMARVATLPAVPAARQKKAVRGGTFLRLVQPGWRLAYAAAAVLAISAGALRLEQRRMEQRKVEVAAAQFTTALQVTNRALDQVSAHLQTTEFGAVQRALEANGGDQ